MTDEEAMELALQEATAAIAHGDVPVGAVLLDNETVVASRHNERERSGDPTAHAEMLAIRDAARSIPAPRFRACTIVVTLEPCAMCAGAIRAAGIGRLVYGAFDPKAGAVRSLFRLVGPEAALGSVEVRSAVGSERAAALLVAFFADLRRGGPGSERSGAPESP